MDSRDKHQKQRGTVLPPARHRRICEYRKDTPQDRCNHPSNRIGEQKQNLLDLIGKIAPHSWNFVPDYNT